LRISAFLGWQLVPEYVNWITRLASFCRVIMFDKRGFGMSDRDVDWTLEERMEDIHAVLDAVDARRAAVYGFSEGGPLAMLFAATYPARVQALILDGSFARVTAAPDYPEGVEEEKVSRGLHEVYDTAWGEGKSMACTHTAAMAVLAKLDVAFASEQRVAAFGSAAARLMRAYATQVEVLRRLRHGGQQFVRVEHVHVNEGGQAVIGNVKTENAKD
jgi:pimeloyl-ACP methyl ester carboxylesterase